MLHLELNKHLSQEPCEVPGAGPKQWDLHCFLTRRPSTVRFTNSWTQAVKGQHTLIASLYYPNRHGMLARFISSQSNYPPTSLAAPHHCCSKVRISQLSHSITYFHSDTAHVANKKKPKKG